MNTETKLYKLYQECLSYKGNKKFSLNVRRSPELQDILKKETSFLSENASLTERIYCWLHDIHEIKMCPYCNIKPLLYTEKLDRGYYKTCGDKNCRHTAEVNAHKKVSPERWKEIAKKSQDTYFERTGYRNIFQNPERMKQWHKDFKEKHGAEYPLQVKEFKNKAKNTTIERYGTGDMFHIQKSLETIEKKYGSTENMYKETYEKRSKAQKESKYRKIVDILNNFDFDILEYNDNTKIFKLKCKKCNHEFTIKRPEITYNYKKERRFCPKCNFKNMTFRSLQEQDLANFIVSICKDKEIKYNKKINGIELDISIPELGLAFDYNGIYWHSSTSGKDISYHFNKKKIAHKAGYQLYYVWEDLWTNTVKRNIIESKIKSIFGIYEKTLQGKNCVIEEININDKKFKDIEKFLRENDIEGNPRNTYKCFAMFYNKHLIMVATVSKYDDDLNKTVKEHYDFVITRLTTKNNYNIIDGQDIMLKYITNISEFSNMLYLLNMDWNGFNLDPVFEKNGFMNTKQLKIFCKQETDGIRKVAEEKDLLLEDTGYLNFWDAGNLILAYKK